MKYLFAVLALVVMCGPAQAARIFDENQNDNELLEPFLFENREKTAARNPLGISGDVRVTGRADRLNDGQRQPKLGDLPDGALVLNSYDDRVYTYKVEANIFLDHSCGCAWTSVKLSAANNLGVAEGTYDKLSLKRALIGYTAYQCGGAKLYGEVGRQFLSDKFDSEVMFGSPLDGGFANYTTQLGFGGDFFVQGAFLVVNATKGQYGWIASAGWENIYRTGLFAKYVIIDWGKDREYVLRVRRKTTVGGVATTESVDSRFRPSYLTSQILVGYKTCLFGKETKIFGAYLYNHDAEHLDRELREVNPGIPRTGLGYERHGAYVGVEFGKVRKCGDWAIKAELQYVEAFCFPEFDNNGIGNNIGSNNGLFSLQTLKGQKAIVISDTRSPLNYWGPKLEFAYAFTDDISGRVQYMHSWGIRKFFGFRRSFERFEVKLIYSF